MANLYSLDQFVNKQVIAKKKLFYYSNADLNSPPKGSFEKGVSCGVVVSYLAANPSLNRPNHWFVFEFSYGHYYFIPILEGSFDTSAFTASGVKDVQTVAAEKAANNSVLGYDATTGQSLGFEYYIGEYLPKLLLIVGGYFVVKYGGAILVEKFKK